MIRKPKTRPVLDSKLKAGDRVITRNNCHTRAALVDAGCVGIITEVYLSYGTGFNYDVEFEACVYKGRYDGRRTWCFGEDKIKLID